MDHPQHLGVARVAAGLQVGPPQELGGHEVGPELAPQVEAVPLVLLRRVTADQRPQLLDPAVEVGEEPLALGGEQGRRPRHGRVGRLGRQGPVLLVEEAAVDRQIVGQGGGVVTKLRPDPLLLPQHRRQAVEDHPQVHHPAALAEGAAVVEVLQEEEPPGARLRPGGEPAGAEPRLPAGQRHRERPGPRAVLDRLPRPRLQRQAAVGAQAHRHPPLDQLDHAFQRARPASIGGVLSGRRR